MVSYKCERCKKVFNRKQIYDGHINRKNKCDEVPESVMVAPLCPNMRMIAPICPNDITSLKVNREHVCADCGTKFARSNGLLRHRNGRCKVPTVPVIQDDKFNLILEKMDVLQKENEILKKKMDDIKPNSTVSGDVVMGNKTTDSNNTTINNVNVIAFSSNSWESVVTEEACKKILKTGFKAVPNLVEHIHLNKGFPLLQNCYITNFRGKHAMTYDGESWKLVETSDVIEKLREDKQDYLELKFDEYRKSLDDVTIKRFDKFLVEKDTDVVINQQKEDIKLLLYNNGGMVKKARKDKNM
jgi:DNA-directed RNA polymerase subunit RPC12/RpoP